VRSQLLHSLASVLSASTYAINLPDSVTLGGAYIRQRKSFSNRYTRSRDYYSGR